MDETESKFWLRMWSLFVLLVTICVVSCQARIATETRSAMENGYQEVLLPGAQQPVWQKIK